MTDTCCRAAVGIRHFTMGIHMTFSMFLFGSGLTGWSACVMQMCRSVGYILNGEVTLALTCTISSNNCLFFRRTVILLLKIVQVSLISPKITSSFHKIVYVNHTLNNYIFIQN